MVLPTAKDKGYFGVVLFLCPVVIFLPAAANRPVANLASRLEALNKKFGTTICVSQSTYNHGCSTQQDTLNFIIVLFLNKLVREGV